MHNHLIGWKDRRQTNMKSKRTILIAALIAGQLSAASLLAEDTNNPSSGALPAGGRGEAELIQQLQKRLEELEQKGKILEGAKEAAERSAEAQAKQRAEELDQKLKAQQREQEAVQQAKDAEAKQRIGELN